MVHELISAYGLLSKCKLISAKLATEENLRSFHSVDYLNYIKDCDTKASASNVNLDASTLDISLAENDFGIGYDCAPVQQMFNLIQWISGGSLAAVEAILSRQVQVAINWTGGWHHALRDEASGYCYVNDINIAILRLLSRGIEKILYIDYDLHHGDGVETAFTHTSKVLTLSFHKYECGFFPGSGSIEESDHKKYSINVPLNDAIQNQPYADLVTRVVQKVVDKYKPQVVIGQLGADTLAGDPMTGFNLTLEGPNQCLKQLLSLNIPLILLGGGGYHSTNTARLWTQLTATALNETIDDEIPDHEHFLNYSPSYSLQIEPNLRKDLNSTDYLETVCTLVSEQIDKL